MDMIRIPLCGLELEARPATTQAFYTGNEPGRCDCAGCRNHRLAWAHMPRGAQAFLSGLGLNPQEPIDAIALCAPNPETVLYDIHYFVNGRVIPSPDATSSPGEPGQSGVSISFSDTCEATIQPQCCVRMGNFPEPCFEVEVFATLPWLLEGKNPF